MKAKKVIDFTQGGNPYKTMKLGSHQTLEINDDVQVINDMWMLKDWSWTTTSQIVFNEHLKKETILFLNDIEDRSIHNMPTSYIFRKHNALEFYYINEEDLHLIKKI